ncbi:MAG: hypothetical protein SFV54_13675 [Bryobacteraceae bacterium]|nr:hypothetical protein [Bryobacteraceae bacterium]
MPDESQGSSSVVVAGGRHTETGESWRAAIVYVPKGSLWEVSIAVFREGQIVESYTMSARRLHLSFAEAARVDLQRYGVTWTSVREMSPEELADLKPGQKETVTPRAPASRAMAVDIPLPKQAPDAEQRAASVPDPTPAARSAEDHRSPVHPESRARSTLRERGAGDPPSHAAEERATGARRAGERQPGIIPYGSEIADAVKSYTDQVDRGAAVLGRDLTDWLDDNPGAGNALWAGLGQSVLDAGVGAMHLLTETFVDPLRVGEGANKGGWRGWGEDILRVTSSMPGPKAAAFIAKGVASTVARIGIKATEKANAGGAARVRRGVRTTPREDLYEGIAAPWRYVKGIAGMHRHHLVLKRILRRCTNPDVRKLEDVIPTVPLEMTEHLTYLHSGLNRYLRKEHWKKSYSTEEVVAALKAIEKYYKEKGLKEFAEAVDAFGRKHFEPW